MATACTVPSENEYTSINKVFIRIENGEAIGGFGSNLPGGFQIERIIRLCNELNIKCLYHCDKVLKKALADPYLAGGEYEVDLSEGEKFLFKPLVLNGESFELEPQ